ncbi:MAG: flagellar export protein FliJ [Magnetococcales bacterium]|nr:flagellar export protein FliJ [Magnetococcales bacterium]
MINRFKQRGSSKRLVELRRIREEANGMALARVLARLEGLRQDVIKLDQQTLEEQTLARDAIGQEGASSDRLALGMMDNFLRGQLWRRKRLEQMIAVADLDLEKAREAWLAARTQLQQAEKLAEKEDLQYRKQAEQQEKKTMDMIGVLRNKTFFGQEGDLG